MALSVVASALVNKDDASTTLSALVVSTTVSTYHELLVIETGNKIRFLMVYE